MAHYDKEREKQKNKGGRPRIVLNEQQRENVKKLAGLLTVEQLADYLGIGRSTFFDIMDRDNEVSGLYKASRSKMIGGVSKSLIQKALDGDTSSMIFYLKTQAGWKEKQGLEVSNADGETFKTDNKWVIEVTDA